MPEEFTLSPRGSRPTKGREDQFAVLECGVCSAVMTSPVMAPCHHYFCSGCWDEHVAEKEPGEALQCPTCNDVVEGEVIDVMTHPRGRIMRSLVLTAPRECIHEGCSWTGTFGDFTEHVAMCPWAPQQCRYSGCGVSLPRSQVGEHEASCPWRTAACPRCYSPVPLLVLSQHAEQAEEVRLSLSDITNIQGRLDCLERTMGQQKTRKEQVDLEKLLEVENTSKERLDNLKERLDHIEGQLEQLEVTKEEIDAKITAAAQDCTTKFESLCIAKQRLERRMKKMDAERRKDEERKEHTVTTQEEGTQKLQRVLEEGLNAALKDMNDTIRQELQKKVHVEDVYKKADVDMLLQQLFDKVRGCNIEVMRLRVSQPEAPLLKPCRELAAEATHACRAAQPEATDPRSEGPAAERLQLPGSSITWSLKDAMKSKARNSMELVNFDSFRRVSSTAFSAADFRGLHLTFFRKQASPQDVPKNWCCLYAPKGTNLEWVVKFGREEKRLEHLFETTRSFGNIFPLPFTPDFDANDISEGVLVFTLFEGKDGRQSAHSRLACVIEVTASENIKGRPRKVAWLAFPDGSEQAVELSWITSVQKLPSVSVTVLHARQTKRFGDDISVTSTCNFGL